jgi:phytoene dehydrogenase-like protein
MVSIGAGRASTAKAWPAELQDSPSSRLSVVVVGAGVSGLCTAGRLLQSGIPVTLVEQNGPEGCGGRLWTERLGPFRFEVGASLLLLPEVYEETFKALGIPESFSEAVGGLTRLDPAYGAFFDRPAWDCLEDDEEGDDDLNPHKVALGASTPHGSRAWRSLLRRAGAEDAADDYSAHASAMLAAGFPLFIDGDVGAALDGDPDARETLRKGLRHVPAFAEAALGRGGNPFVGHAEALRQRLPPYHTPHPPPIGSHAPPPSMARRMVRAALSFQDLYVGLTPSSAPNVFSLLHAVELDPRHGIYYPCGGDGFGEVVQILARRVLGHPLLREALFHTTCHGMVRASDDPRRITGVEVATDTGTRTLPASAVVMSGDRAETAPLLEGGADADRMATAEYSSSSVTFLFGIAPEAAPRVHRTLEHHNVFLSEAASPEEDDGGYYGAAGWAACLPRGGQAAAFPIPAAADPPARFPFYVCCASKTDPTAAPHGGATIMVLVPVPALRDGGAGPEADEAERQLVAAARRGAVRALVHDARAFETEADFEAAVAAERVVAPTEWQRRFLPTARRGVRTQPQPRPARPLPSWPQGPIR